MAQDLRQQITTALAALPPGDHEVTLTAQGRQIHMKLRRERKAKALLVTFHGAAVRKDKPLPFFPSFAPRLANVAHQVVISDPSLVCDDDLNLAWYAGDAGFDAQSVLPQVFAGLADELGAERTIYLGASGGGFAALYYSHRHPGSFAVSGNPQVSIETYILQSAVSRYRKHCWPDVPETTSLNEVTCADLIALYAKGFENTVIYVQTMGDRSHFEGQMMPFIAGMTQAANKDRFLLHSDFWGQIGHVPIPRDYVRWVRAVCMSPTTDIPDILAIWHDLDPAAITPPPPPRTTAGTSAGTSADKSGRPAAFSASDLAMADRLSRLRAAADL